MDPLKYKVFQRLCVLAASPLSNCLIGQSLVYPERETANVRQFRQITFGKTLTMKEASVMADVYSCLLDITKLSASLL